MTNDRVIRMIQNVIDTERLCLCEDNGKIHKLLTLAQPRRISRIYPSDCSLVYLFVCLFLNGEMRDRSYFACQKPRRCNPIESLSRKEICCYFVKISKLACGELQTVKLSFIFINVIHYTFSALNLLRMIAMRELFYYHFMRVEERIKMCI